MISVQFLEGDEIVTVYSQFGNMEMLVRVERQLKVEQDRFAVCEKGNSVFPIDVLTGYFQFPFQYSVLGSFLSFTMLARRGGDGCYRCDETVRALARRKGLKPIFPTFFPSEVGVVGVELELYFVL